MRARSFRHTKQKFIISVFTKESEKQSADARYYNYDAHEISKLQTEQMCSYL